ncbi:MAG: hypothetical protein ACREHE_11555 [Rhizomicrobium sp.]
MADDLTQWKLAAAQIPARGAALARDPAFPAAARALASGMLALAQSDAALDGIFKDAGRYMTAMWALYLHQTGGLTLPRLKAVCAASGYLSPGRARAMLHYLRHLGYVAPVPRTKPVRYVPTEAFVTAWRRHLGAAMAAARFLEPAIGPLVERMQDRETFECLARSQSEGLLRSAPSIDQGDALVRVFQHRNAGSQILWLLIEASENGEFPPSRCPSFSVAATARRFRVSRIHVRRLLADAERAGFLKTGPGGALIFSDAGRAALTASYAGQLVLVLASCAAASAELAKLSRAA